ncbi:MAG: hypothetical protein HZA27_01250 [Candidatus Omnitrophica bacterium]|nr:hypothetical protein [Candidatus Omnitrophota bacterium]
MAYQICKKCVLDSNIPGISFDLDGICNFCSDYIKRELPTKLNYELLEKEFVKLTKRDFKKYQYDCICLYSGGKDSSYMLYNLIKKYKLRVLAFTLDHGFLSDEAFFNIRKVVTKLKVDSIIYRPSRELITAVLKTGIFFYNNLPTSKELAFVIGHVCWPCFVLIAMSSIKFAVEKQIPNVIVGTTPGQIRQKKFDLVSKYNDLIDVYKTMVVPMLKLLKVSSYAHFTQDLDLSFLKKLKVLKVRLISFYEHHEYNEERVIKTVENEFDWQRPRDTDSCSSNCLLNSLGIEIHRRKYGISPYAIPFARDVREGLLDRGESLKTINVDLNMELVKHIAQELGVDLKNISSVKEA